MKTRKGDILAMKKFITTFMMMALMAISIPMFATSQTPRREERAEAIRRITKSRIFMIVTVT